MDQRARRLVTSALQPARHSDVGVDGIGEQRGVFVTFTEEHEPTPTERALDILWPHLVREPLYRDAR